MAKGVNSKKSIEIELKRIEESAMYSSQSQFEQAKFWRSINLILGVPAAVLAAIAGATGLAAATNRVTAAYLALAAAGLGALVTTLNTNRRSTQAHSAANAYLEVQTTSRQLYEIDLPNSTYQEARTQLQELTARRDEINKTADIPAFYAYWKGKKNIKKDRQKNKVDKKKDTKNGNKRK